MAKETFGSEGKTAWHDGIVMKLIPLAAMLSKRYRLRL
jgi:hypothetical protein